MVFNVKGKVVLITGASSGFGKLLSERLARKGAKLVMSDVNEKAGQLLADALNSTHGKDTAIFVKCDVSSSEQLKALFAAGVRKYGRLDVVVNNAGIGETGRFISPGETNWKKVIDIDLTAVVEGTYLALNQMRSQSPQGGVIVNVASMAGYLPSVEFPVYTAAKHGVVGLTKSLGKRVIKELGVRVVGIAPSFAETPLLAQGKNDPAFQAVVGSVGTVPVESVIDAMEAAIENENLAGDIIRITQRGLEVVHPFGKASKL
ncbi:hypothetical protein HDV05_004972 [Chytridiales sp. JEL 0842]|nr:hypothetical protein HDV05_004972 [Chytridiales sp. JEL 0842]